MFLVVLIMSVILIAIFSLQFLTKTDVATTSNLLRELLATQLGESIATQIETRVNCTPWTKRFWLLEAMTSGTYTPGSGIVPAFTLTKDCKYINLSKDSLPPDEYDFVGTVKDSASPEPDIPPDGYCIYLEVTVRDETYAFTWQKRWEQSLLIGLNRDTTQLDKPMGPLSSAPTETDSILDGVATQIQQVPPPDGSGAAQITRLKRLNRDEHSFHASAVPSGPQSPPTLFPR